MGLPDYLNAILFQEVHVLDLSTRSLAPFGQEVVSVSTV